MRIGQAVRRARRDRSWSQEDLADACGLDRSYVGQVERGEKNISIESLLMLCRGLKVKPSTIFLDAEL